MLIDPMILQDVAVEGPRSIPVRMSLDDPTLTYEEVVLYLMCRYGHAAEAIDPDEDFAAWEQGEKLLDRQWCKLKASKTHPMMIEHPWDEIFPEYKKRLAEEKARKANKK